MRETSDDWRDPVCEVVRGDALAAFLKKVEYFCGHENGPRILPENMCHKIVDDPPILQLSGMHPYRFPFFELANKGVVVTHAFRKPGGKTETTPSAERARAVRQHSDFHEAYREGRVEWYEEPD